MMFTTTTTIRNNRLVQHIATLPSRVLSTQAKEGRVETNITSEGIGHVVFNRPDKLNALDLTMFEAIAKTASDLRTDRSLRVVILRGNGRAFCTGLDVVRF